MGRHHAGEEGSLDGCGVWVPAQGRDDSEFGTQPGTISAYPVSAADSRLQLGSTL
jgi:hypothetical protein